MREAGVANELPLPIVTQIVHAYVPIVDHFSLQLARLGSLERVKQDLKFWFRLLRTTYPNAYVGIRAERDRTGRKPYQAMLAWLGNQSGGFGSAGLLFTLVLCGLYKNDIQALVAVLPLFADLDMALFLTLVDDKITALKAVHRLICEHRSWTAFRFLANTANKAMPLSPDTVFALALHECPEFERLISHLALEPRFYYYRDKAKRMNLFETEPGTKWFISKVQTDIARAAELSHSPFFGLNRDEARIGGIPLLHWFLIYANKLDQHCESVLQISAHVLRQDPNLVHHAYQGETLGTRLQFRRLNSLEERFAHILKKYTPTANGAKRKKPSIRV